MAEAQYEFNNAQNEIILGLSQKINIVSIFLIVVGILITLIGIIGFIVPDVPISNPISNLIDGIIYFLIGLWGKRAANSFRQIVDTQGNDIDHLMSALGELKKGATLIFWLLIIVIIIFAIAFIFAMIAAMAPHVATV
jgi:CHASE3 domain sensor protein